MPTVIVKTQSKAYFRILEKFPRVRDVFLLEYLRDFAIRTEWNCVSGRQSHWSLGHSFSLRSRLLSQKPAKPFGNEIAQRGSTLYGCDFGTLQQIIR